MIDEKVVSRAIENFDRVLPKQNKYIIILPKKDYKPVHVKLRGDNIFFTTYKSRDFYEAVGNLQQYKNVLIHMLTWNMVDFVNHNAHPAYTWLVWGGDLYNEFLDYLGYEMFYDPAAIKKAQGRNSLFRRLLYPVETLLHAYRVRQKKKAISRISYYSAVACDIELLLKHFPSLSHLKEKNVACYYRIEEIIKEEKINGNNIIVGNSAYAAGNHIEVFKELSKIDIGDRKVIVPLSYGDIAAYVIKEGEKVLGNSFMPLVDFMPLDEYNKLLSSVRTFIYGNYRQAAIGNIVVAFCIGATVFLHDKNPLLQEFRNAGFVLFSVSELAQKINYELTSEEKEQNKRLIKSQYSTEVIDKDIKDNFG